MDRSPAGCSVHADSLGMNTGVGCHALLQGIFPAQESKRGPLHCRWILYQLSYLRSPNQLSVQFSSVAQSCMTLCDCKDCSMPGFPVLHCLPEFAQTHVHESTMTSYHLILCCPLLPLSSIFLSIRVFSNRSDLCIWWPKH